MDSLNHKAGGSIGMFGCHNQGGNQAWTLTRGKELRHDDLCVEARSKEAGHEVLLSQCADDTVKETQYFEYDPKTGHIQSVLSGLCLEGLNTERRAAHHNAFLKTFPCEDTNPHQRWQFQQIAPPSK